MKAWSGSGQTGPLVRRLESFGDLKGLVVGPWADASSDLHQLIKVLAEQRVLMRSRARGEVCGEDTLGVVVGQIRRVLSCAFVRVNALCLLARIGQLGPGARSAAQRRNAALRGEAARRRELEGHWLAHVRGRGLSRVGMVFVP